MKILFSSLVFEKMFRVDEGLFLSLLLSRVWGGLGFCSLSNFSSFIFEFEGATMVIFYFILASHCFTLSRALN
jgi:hypothetical protein